MPGQHHDIFTENPIRYIGYCSGFAQAIGPTVASRYLHGITVGFIFAHTLYEPMKVNVKSNAPPDKLARSSLDTMIYETAASGIFPPIFAKLVRRVGVKLLHKPIGSFAGWASSAITVASLLIVSRPADMIIDEIMNVTARKMY